MVEIIQEFQQEQKSFVFIVICISSFDNYGPLLQGFGQEVATFM